MSPNPNKLLAVLLALIVAFVPMGGALAASHACEEGSEGLTAMDHSQHLGAAQIVTSDATSSDFFGSCQDCSGDCCTGNTCSANACGASVVLANIGGAQVDAAHGAFNENPSDSAITNRQTPPFRPPRV